jgi:hypothetical protein
LRASTFADATTAPLGSAIVPLMDPRSLCANTAEAVRNKNVRIAPVRMKPSLPLIQID